jgi:hypothetical protein
MFARQEVMPETLSVRLQKRKAHGTFRHVCEVLGLDQQLERVKGSGVGGRLGRQS